MSEIEKKWYVLRAVSGKESKVKEYLDADIKNSDLSEYVSQVLIPTEKVYQVRNGKKIVKERSYLPGYVLVEAALVGEVAHHLRNTPNVIGFLGGSENPVPLRQSEVNRILGTVDELQEGGEELNVPYTVGEKQSACAAGQRRCCSGYGPAGSCHSHPCSGCADGVPGHRPGWSSCKPQSTSADAGSKPQCRSSSP